MICPKRFVDMLTARGIRLATGVPCSYLTEVINTVIGHPEMKYIGAANEGDAVAIACGGELGGRRTAVWLQNSGLGNAVSPLTSLTSTFRIPVLLLVTWRGEPNGSTDEPQHGVMGQITPGLLSLMGVRWQMLPDREDGISQTLDSATAHMETTGTPFALIVRKGIFDKSPLVPPAPADGVAGAGQSKDGASGTVHDPDEVLRTVQRSVGENDAVLATTGYTGRALYALDDRPNQFYMVGSMGCISSLGLGLATVQPERKFVVLDGDGAFLMRMGAAAVVGHERPSNLIHVLLDNRVHDSTGSQATVSSSIDAVGIARACGYPQAHHVDRLDMLADILRAPADDLTFLHVRTRPRVDRKLPRPHVPPDMVATRFREWLRKT